MIGEPSPLVTIGVPTYNRADTLAAAVRSALAQTYQNIEVVVSDNASTDGTASVILSFRDDRLRYIRHQANRGMLANFNSCLEMASGSFFLMLSDDDTLKPNAIEDLLKPLVEGARGASPDSIAMAWCPCSTVDSDGKELWTTAAGAQLEASLEMILRAFNGRHVPRFCGFLLRVEDARAVGGYSERYGPLCDTANWMRVAARYSYVACVQSVLANYTMHTSSETNRIAVKVWLDGGINLLEDMRAYYLKQEDPKAANRLKAVSRNFFSSQIAGVVLQRVGQRGWLSFALGAAIRWPQYTLTPYVVRRLLNDGWKLLPLSTRSELGH